MRKARVLIHFLDINKEQKSTSLFFFLALCSRASTTSLQYMKQKETLASSARYITIRKKHKKNRERELLSF